MKTFRSNALLASALVLAIAFGGPAHASAASVSALGSPASTVAAPAEPDAAVLAQMAQAAHDGRFGAAYKRGLRSSPQSDLRDRVLALDDDIVDGVFARIAARRFDLAEATAIAAFYASPAGRTLTEAQLADPQGPPPEVAPAQRETIEAFFAGDTGRKFNSMLSDPAMREELQLALVFVAGPGAGN
jgi:hypothetical protein